MACSASMTDQAFHVRSSSLPSRSHPLAIRLEAELHQLRTCIAPSTSSVSPQLMCNCLQGLGDMYDCINELLCLPCNQQDLCAALRDSLDMAKGHIQQFKTVGSKLQTYIRLREKADKDIKNCFRYLKQMSKCRSYPTLILGEQGAERSKRDHHLTPLHRLLFHVHVKAKTEGRPVVVRVQKLQCQLETLEACIEGLETGLDCLSRRLIRNRVSILNILSL